MLHCAKKQNKKKTSGDLKFQCSTSAFEFGVV